MSPKVAIVILNWNGRSYLEQFLPSVLQSTYENKEIIVADNASTDDSIQLVEEKFPSVKIIRLKENHGFARGYNEALQLVPSDYYVLLNSDVEVTPGWIEPVVEMLENDKSIAAAQPKVLSYSNKQTFEYAGAAGGWMDYLGYPFARGRVFDYCEKDTGQYDDITPVFWASGASLFVRASAFHEMKGFDSYFFAHMEEIDFCWRLQLGGYKIYVCPPSVVYHVGAGTLQRESPRKTFLNFRNNLIMLFKNLDLREAIWKIPLRIFLDAVSAWKFLFSNGSIYFMAVLKAHFAFLYWIIFNQKESIFPTLKKGKLDGWLNKSIVWEHFVAGKKTFTQIVKNKN